MSNTKDTQMSGSKSAMGKKEDAEFTSGKQSGAKEKKMDSKKGMSHDDTETAGGRKGNFSDKDRENESQWSPGSTQSSDR